MEKDIDKMKKAVLAYCEEVCPNVLINVTPIGFGDLCIHKDESEDTDPCWQIGTIGRPKILAIIQPKYFISDSQIDECIAAYRLLGLEARDAVAVANQRAQKAIQACADYAQSVYVAKDNTIAELQTRNTALVAALEEIRKPAMIIGFGKKATVKMRIDQLFEDHKRVRLIAKNALAANTEKGGLQG